MPNVIRRTEEKQLYIFSYYTPKEKWFNNADYIYDFFRKILNRARNTLSKYKVGRHYTAYELSLVVRFTLTGDGILKIIIPESFGISYRIPVGGYEYKNVVSKTLISRMPTFGKTVVTVKYWNIKDIDILLDNLIIFDGQVIMTHGFGYGKFFVDMDHWVKVKTSFGDAKLRIKSYDELQLTLKKDNCQISSRPISYKVKPSKGPYGTKRPNAIEEIINKGFLLYGTPDRYRKECLRFLNRNRDEIKEIMKTVAGAFVCVVDDVLEETGKVMFDAEIGAFEYGQYEMWVERLTDFIKKTALMTFSRYKLYP